MKLDPDTPLGDVAWIPRNRIANLGRLGLATLRDLVLHYPRRHEDRSKFAPFPDGESAVPVLLSGLIVKANYLPYGGWKRGYQAVIEEEAGLGNQVACRWFNMPYVGKSLAVGLRLVVFGRTKKRGKQTIIDFPEYEIIDPEDPGDLIHLNRIVPVHPAGEGVSPKRLREWIHEALAVCDLAAFPSLLPVGAGESGARLEPRHLVAIHFPESAEALADARRALVREEFFAMQALIASRRARWAALPGVKRKPSGDLLATLIADLPFTLTGAQRRAISEIRADLAEPRRMNRMLQGDVGSGKTLVALAAALLAIEAGDQAVLMAPTQILAEQHFFSISRLVGPLGVPVSLRTGSRVVVPDAPSVKTRGRSGSGGAGLLIGTHALLHDPAELAEPGLIIIDEQHKFGVLQRARLAERASAPDVLVMTATPIPRTLAQTAYGDLDVTTLDELPPGRGKILTGVRPPKKLPEATSFLREQLDGGRQVYIVYPLIDESEKLAVKAAAEEFARWEPLLAPHACGLLHGRLAAAEKDAVMAAFRGGDLRVLISTTVIEVGVDVPNATVMLIENAERFGLAQLHQLRGRIGRGAHTSYCILVPGEDTPEARERLGILEQTTDGFAVAEADLNLRGPGDLLGTNQTGLPPLRLGNLVTDGEVMAACRALARRIFAEDPGLERSEHAPIRAWIARFVDLAALGG